MAEQNFEWVRWNTQQFIDLIREHPCLWQVRNKNYKNKSEKCKPEYTNKTIHEYNKLCNNTINDYEETPYIEKSIFPRGERDKTSQKSGAGTDDLYLPRLWCYHPLAFLGDGDTPHHSVRGSIVLYVHKPPHWG